MNLGTNDAHSTNNVTAEGYVEQYIALIQGVHGVWPDAQIILVVRCPFVSPSLTEEVADDKFDTCTSWISFSFFDIT